LPLSNKESLKDFLSIAFHDLREPLRAIRAGTEMVGALCGESSNEKVARNLRFVTDGADRLELLIRNLADFSTEELRDMERVSVPLDQALLNAKNQLAAELSRNDAVVTHDHLPAIHGDFHALSLLFRCLIDNACKFRGQAAPTIHVAANQTPREWIVSVQDNGMGFDPQYAEQIFRPFERLSGRKYPGSGLGLTLAKRIVERHGGRIWAESRPEHGSVFSFSWPLQ